MAPASPDQPKAVDSAALSRAIARGDEAAFATFYTAWFPATRRAEAFCLDVVQDVMFTVSRKLPALRDERAVRAWMGTAVARAITDRARGERRRRQREQLVADGRSDTHDGEPWRALLADERAAWLASRVAELSPDDQALLSARPVHRDMRRVVRRVRARRDFARAGTSATG